MWALAKSTTFFFAYRLCSTLSFLHINHLSWRCFSAETISWFSPLVGIIIKSFRLIQASSWFRANLWALSFSENFGACSHAHVMTAAEFYDHFVLDVSDIRSISRGTFSCIWIKREKLFAGNWRRCTPQRWNCCWPSCGQTTDIYDSREHSFNFVFSKKQKSILPWARTSRATAGASSTCSIVSHCRCAAA